MRLARRLALVNVLHVAEGNAFVVMVAGIFEIEGVAREENEIAVEIFGDR